MEVLTLIPNRYGFSSGQRSSIELWERVLAPAGIRLHWAPFETERLREILYQPGHTFTKAAEMVRSYVQRLLTLRRRRVRRAGCPRSQQQGARSFANGYSCASVLLGGSDGLLLYCFALART